ncbi:MAG: tripartite tricarboxylate transporter substrate binding protein [Betaproteobacteria bacterium]|nr:MAG: tripartite tricarboxylate transporter substrate binding protein [Betaproteobacteria bacterium]
MSRLFIVAANLSAAGLLSALAGAAASAEDFPNRPIRMVVPYPPGGSNDFLARLYSVKMTEMLGQQVVVDNRGGANTIIGNNIVAKSSPDGYTLLLAGSTQTAIPHLYRNIPYDSLNDFAPIAGIARSEFLLVVNPAVPVKTVDDLIALAKKKPGGLNYATSSTGGPTHLGAVHFQMLTGVTMQQVPYKGGGPAMIDLVGGQVQLGFANPAGSIPLVQAGRLRAVAVTGEKRLDALPQVPTFTEAGVPGLALRNWYAITAPAATPKFVIDKLSSVILKIAAMPESRAALLKRGLDTFIATPGQIDALRREDWAINAKVIKAAGIKMQD